MTNNEKTFAAVALVGAFALGWFLHKPENVVGGSSLIHFQDPADGVISYKIYDQNNLIQDWTYNSADLTLPDSEYWVVMSHGG